MQISSLEDRVRLAQLMMSLLDDWRISDRDRIALLGLPPQTRPRAMRRYAQDTPLPDDPETMQRVEHLIGIADALHTTYLHNARMGSIWMTAVNYRFDDRTPLACMLEDGLAGLVAVRSHLDCAYGWHLDEQMSRR